VRAYRICKRRYLENAFSGEGAFKYGGRWNSKGRRVVYTGGNPAIAVLEVIVHLDEPSDLDHLHYVLVPVNFDERLVSHPESLPADWSADPPPLSAAAVGDAWILAGSSAVLEVPSAVVPMEKNYLINVGHSGFHKILIGDPEPLHCDPRLKKRWPSPQRSPAERSDPAAAGRARKLLSRRSTSV
jgi:RES domain-containing protein